MHDDELIQPWFEHVMDSVPGVSLFDVHAHAGSNDPDGFRLSIEDLVATLEAARARSVVMAMHEPDGIHRRERLDHRGVRGLEWAPGAVLPHRSARGRARGGEPLPRRRRPRAQAASARRGLRAVPSGRGRRVRARSRAQDPGADPRGARDPDARTRRGRARAPLPGGAGDPRPRGDLRPELDLARGGAAAEPLLRHELVEPDRPRRALHPRPARPDHLRERSAVLHAGAGRDVRLLRRATRRSRRRAAAGHLRRSARAPARR